MYYVYILTSLSTVGARYVGYTANLRKRFNAHNAGTGARHTKKYKPWKLVTYVAFSNKKKALAYERYLKTASGIAIMRKRLL